MPFSALSAAVLEPAMIWPLVRFLMPNWVAVGKARSPPCSVTWLRWVIGSLLESGEVEIRLPSAARVKPRYSVAACRAPVPVALPANTPLKSSLVWVKRALANTEKPSPTGLSKSTR